MTPADLDDFDIESYERKKRRTLRHLLDERRGQHGRAIGINSMMGSSVSFVTTVSLSWAAEHIQFASDLPMFNEYRDENGFIKPDHRTQDLIQQRDLDWRRQLPMTLYLAARNNHKFPALLVVVTRPWVDDPRAEEWNRDGIAREHSLVYTRLDTDGEFVDMSLDSNTASILYAIDGQHRLMAIKGLRDFIDHGRLARKTQKGVATKTQVTVEDVIEGSRRTIGRSDIHQLLHEKIGIEIIPSVIRGETRQEALRRLRTIFVHVNRTASPLSKGELALLDEDDGFAVVARMIMTTHPLLKDRVRPKGHQLPETSKDLTTLETLRLICEKYLTRKYPAWEKDPLTKMPTRPEWDELCDGRDEMNEFFDRLAELPSFDHVCQGGVKKIPVYRKLTTAGGKGHLLFRPLAQVALAGALADMLGDGKASAKQYWEKLENADRKGWFQVDDPRYPWLGVAVEVISRKMRRNVSYRNLIQGILTHVLGGGTFNDERREELRSEFAAARLVSEDGERALDLKGKRVRLESVTLPRPW